MIIGANPLICRFMQLDLLGENHGCVRMDASVLVCSSVCPHPHRRNNQILWLFVSLLETAGAAPLPQVVSSQGIQVWNQI